MVPTVSTGLLLVWFVFSIQKEVKSLEKYLLLKPDNFILSKQSELTPSLLITKPVAFLFVIFESIKYFTNLRKKKWKCYKHTWK